jgi:hypothetical protein
MPEKQLWEHEHPYVAVEGSVNRYKSWKDYFDHWKNYCDDLNFVYRFDFYMDEDEETLESKPRERHPDPNYRAYELVITIILQRKGRFITNIIDVCENDMDDIKKYLEEKFEYIKKVWYPIGSIFDKESSN